jgi:hypothetical protein
VSAAERNAPIRAVIIRIDVVVGSVIGVIIGDGFIRGILLMPRIRLPV